MEKIVEKTLGVADVAILFAEHTNTTKKQATEYLYEFLNIIVDACTEHNGVTFRDYFSIKPKVQKGRSGEFKGVAYETEDKNTLKLTVSKTLIDKMN